MAPPSISNDEDDSLSGEDAGGSDFDWQSDMEDELGEASDSDVQADIGLDDSSDGAFDAEDEDAEDEDEEDGTDGTHDMDEDARPSKPHRDNAQPRSRYIPPALRGASDTDSAMLPRVRGLLNRLAEGTLSWVVSQLEELHREARQAVETHVIDQLIQVRQDCMAGQHNETSCMHITFMMQAVSEGPRATDAFAAVTACCVAALAAKTRSQALAARFLQRLARSVHAAKEQGVTCTSNQ